MKTVFSTLVLVVFSLVSTANSFGYTITTGQPVQWGNPYGNLHWYQLCIVHYSAGETFLYSHLEEFAESQIYLGHPGYLVTITSNGESAFLGYGEYYLGLHRSDVWRWVGGPEEGEEPVFTSWGSGEPDAADCAYTVGIDWRDNYCERVFDFDDEIRMLIEYGGLTRYDCNNNGEDDRDEIASHPSLDFNGDGILDECQPGVAGVEVPGPVTRLHDSFPNPFNPQTTIAFDISERGLVSLRVFDMAGRLLRELIGPEEYTPGRHEVVWNGRDDWGRQVASGAYFYRLETGNYSKTKRMVLVK